MTRFFHPLLFWIARSTESELTKYLQYLKEENQLLRGRLPKQVRTTPAERARLVQFGLELGDAIYDLVTIVRPQTFRRWIREQGNSCQRRVAPHRPIGRPRTAESIRQLVVQLARENTWGYTRILGELRKLGINSISRATVRNILKEHGINPAPERDHGTWSQFLKMHADTLWACDFFSMPVCTLRGMVPYFVLFFIHLKSRGVWVSSATAHPDRHWTTQQARNFCMDHGYATTRLIRDHDRKFTASFDDVFVSEQARIVLPTVRSPALNAYAERWVRSIKHECLNHFVILGERHLNHLVYEYAAFYNKCRPHSGRGYLPPLRVGPYPGDGIVRSDNRLGGLLKHYYRQAA